MLDKDTLIKVTNRDNGYVGYTIPDLGNLHRNFAPGETKTIAFDELQKLSWVPGGERILKDYLIIDNDEAVRMLVADVEPEYFYTKEDVEKLLGPQGTLAQLQDCLDFAPTGVIELVKDVAVKTKLNDMSKREAIFQKTGFNVTNAIAINIETDGEEVEKTNSSRRAAPINQKIEEPQQEETTPQGRRTTPPQKYKVITKK